MPDGSYLIAQVTPYAWEHPHEVNRYVERLSSGLRDRGHQVVVVAPSESRSLVRDSRAAIASLGSNASEGLPPLLAPAQAVRVSGRRSGALAPTANATKPVERLLDRVGFDFVHVHEPFGPGLSSLALRHSRALNVGTFHSTAERVVSTQVARRFFALFFGRLDARTATSRAAADLLNRHFPGAYEVVLPGADVPEPAEPREEDGIVDIAFLADEERPALRLFLRAVRKLPATLPWRATVWSADAPAPQTAPLARAIRDRVHFSGGSGDGSDVLARADIAVAASTGTAPSPQLLRRILAAGAVPVAARLPEYEELLDDGELGLLFMPRDAETLTAQLARLVRDEQLRQRLRARSCEAADGLGWELVAERFEACYSDLAARRHPEADAETRRRLAGRELIDVDLHMHTDHSHDCATPVPTLLRAAAVAGLGAIAVTDHNEISGALEARELAAEHGVKVIVAEEVKTADQGEVIGLFLEQKIERGMTLAETIAEIRRQGGLVYVPHPFDRMHSVPDYEHLLAVVEQIDAIEVFNSRVAIASFNDEAARFAAKYRIAAGAGSDSHVPQGLGSVRIRMRDFDGPAEFLESLREADIVRRKQSLLYVQALKFIQTRGPTAPRRATR